MSNGRIQILPPEEARRIAAGEVIDRPAALIREFLDNAIDAGGSLIEVFIEGGGAKRAEVIDNGDGMSRDDLALCWETHATSKIRSLEDLNTAETLGFRGEALAAAAAVSRLEIATSTDGREAWKLEIGPGERNPAHITQSRRTKGTSVRALDLFDSIPARKRFLKRDGSEAGLCRQIFIDKALAFPAAAFRYTQDGNPKCFLPAAASKKERFAAALLQPNEEIFLHEIHTTGSGFSADIVIGGSELYRADRRQLFVFANGRRLSDFALLQALEYGTQGLFPNGTHPVGAVFIAIDPKLADFNIHPAKREARFADPGAIHHAVTSSLRDFSHRLSLSRSGAADISESIDAGNFDEKSFQHLHSGYSASSEISGGLALEALLEKAPLKTIAENAGVSFAAETAPSYGFSGGSEAPRFAGRAFGLFILMEYADRLFIIDQHAAHERLLYDRFLTGPIPKQELLVPIPFSTESNTDDRFLEEKKAELAVLAIDIERDGTSWRIEALPADWRLGDAETVRAILDLRGARENMAERWAATLSCHGAIRDGTWLDDKTAADLGREALALRDPHCPHGRPIWTEIRREALFQAVRRS
ncbi:MAG: DNA mismatch repair endonuclease MutL [Treponema sp.]|jgi:DNA mismatch repair protein MutL|nr:DNA mismatch repair endonuclease MutL [Treponema sp.]